MIESWMLPGGGFAGSRRHVARLLLWLGALALLGGCGSAPPPPPAPPIVLTAEITVADDLNPDAAGRSSPLLLAIYQLKNAEGFLNKDFFAVFDPAGGALGGDSIVREQLTLQPGGSRIYTAEFASDARFIGVAAAFSDLENAEWRAVVEVPDAEVLRNSPVRITVGGNMVAIAMGEG